MTITGTHGSYDLDRDGAMITITREGTWCGDWTVAHGTTADLGEDQDLVEQACLDLVADEDEA